MLQLHDVFSQETSKKLKKASLDPDVLSNYRPVSNLSFVSKVLEKVVSECLDTHKRYQ